MKDMIAIVLPSGIGVRFRDLTSTQCDQVLLTAAQELPEKGSMMQLGQIETRLALEAMVKQVTVGLCCVTDIKNEKGEVVGGERDANHPDNKWEPFDPDKYAEIFEDNRDHVTLKTIYQERHRVDQRTIAAIMGKAVRVAT